MKSIGGKGAGESKVEKSLGLDLKMERHKLLLHWWGPDRLSLIFTAYRVGV